MAKYIEIWTTASIPGEGDRFHLCIGTPTHPGNMFLHVNLNGYPTREHAMYAARKEGYIPWGMQGPQKKYIRYY